MVAWALDSQPLAEHIRPSQPHRDLSALADLIEVAFGDDLERTGSRMVRDLRQMVLAGPLLQLARPVADFLSGFVWMEGNDLVGNVSVTHKGRGAWALTNVAVLPEYRGRGIASQLVDTAIEHVRRHAGQRLLLQVRADNPPAQALYKRRGWRAFDCWHELNLAKNGWPTVLGSLSPALRRVRTGDGRDLQNLAIASIPVATQRQLPFGAKEFRRDWRWALARSLQLAFTGCEALELAGPRQGALVAYARLAANLSSDPYEVVVRVAPSERGRWEAPLLEGLFILAHDLPRRDLRAYISATHPEAVTAMHQVGFKTLRVLDQMVLELGRSGPQSDF
jgi:ribosomal protein S18 acetylase RimI-like enzyme